jgi:hypothetical protein
MAAPRAATPVIYIDAVLHSYTEAGPAPGLRYVDLLLSQRSLLPHRGVVAERDRVLTRVDLPVMLLFLPLAECVTVEHQVDVSLLAHLEMNSLERTELFVCVCVHKFSAPFCTSQSAPLTLRQTHLLQRPALCLARWSYIDLDDVLSASCACILHTDSHRIALLSTVARPLDTR